MSKSKKQLKKELKEYKQEHANHCYDYDCLRREYIDLKAENDALLKKLHESERLAQLDCGHLEVFEEAIHAACNDLYHSIKATRTCKPVGAGFQVEIDFDSLDLTNVSVPFYDARKAVEKMLGFHD